MKIKIIIIIIKKRSLLPDGPSGVCREPKKFLIITLFLLSNWKRGLEFEVEEEEEGEYIVGERNRAAK